MTTTVKEKPFTVIADRHCPGCTVCILPSWTSMERLHKGRYGMICKVVPVDDYADRQTSYLYMVLIDGEEWPYSHFEVRAVFGNEEATERQFLQADAQ